MSKYFPKGRKISKRKLDRVIDDLLSGSVAVAGSGFSRGAGGTIIPVIPDDVPPVSPFEALGFVSKPETTTGQPPLSNFEDNHVIFSYVGEGTGEGQNTLFSDAGIRADPDKLFTLQADGYTLKALKKVTLFCAFTGYCQRTLGTGFDEANSIFPSKQTRRLQLERTKTAPTPGPKETRLIWFDETTPLVYQRPLISGGAATAFSLLPEYVPFGFSTFINVAVGDEWVFHFYRTIDVSAQIATFGTRVSDILKLKVALFTLPETLKYKKTVWN